MTRRALFRRLASAALGVALMRTLPGIAPTQAPFQTTITAATGPTRFDVRYGYGIWNENVAARVRG